MEENLFQQYVGKELREFIFNENDDTIDNRTVWVYVDNIWNLVYYSDNFLSLCHLGGVIKKSLIENIMCDNSDISIIINNPFKGVD